VQFSFSPWTSPDVGSSLRWCGRCLGWWNWFCGALPQCNVATGFLARINPIRKRLPANWKASAEAFLEAYHILETHSQSIYTAGDANAQYDVFGDHVSRFIHTIGTTSPHPEESRLSVAFDAVTIAPLTQ